jgi:BirA family biotin operon repressor/biotin-[acetyl-CoA-carboxylase] ligase
LHQGAEAAWPALQATWSTHAAGLPHCPPHFSIDVLPEAASTNATLMNRVRQSHAQPTLLVAAHQSAGRGRMGKTWASAPGGSLTFSLALPLAPESWSGLSLAVGVSVAESLSRATPGLVVQLKWPNDLWVQGQKLVGILIETAHVGAQRWAVVGVGINLAVPTLPPAPLESAAPGAVVPAAMPPTGLWAWGQPSNVGEVLSQVAPALLRDVLLFAQNGFAPFRARFAQRDALWQQALRLSDGTEGTGAGVDAQGALQLLTPQGLCVVRSQEVSVRPCVASEAAC